MGTYASSVLPDEMLQKCNLSYDIASGGEITPYNKINKPRIGLQISALCNDVHYNIG